jgi:hypothetical protein
VLAVDLDDAARKAAAVAAALEAGYEGVPMALSGAVGDAERPTVRT